MAKLLNRIINGVADVEAGIASIPSKVRGTVADVRRGQALYRRGIGKYYDSSLTIARKGIKNPDRH